MPLLDLDKDSTLLLKNGSINGTALNNASIFDEKGNGDYFGSSRLESTRLIIQALHDLGYSTAAEVLEHESSCSIESPEVVAFRDAILDGRWSDSERLIESIQLKENTDITTLLFHIRQQKYLELLEQRRLVEALTVLRDELTSIDHDTSQLHFLSSLMMCSSTDDLKLQSGWSGSDGLSRQELLGALQKYISPAVMIPAHRLATLLDQAKRFQVYNCLYHISSSDISLYSDHQCDKSNFPMTTTHVLAEHSSEVWFVVFSNDGTKLASASKDLTVRIWDMTTFKTIHTFGGHSHGVTSLAWSPDDRILISCSDDRSAKLWNVHDGTCLLTLPYDDAVTSCAWLSSGDRFLTGSLDPEKAIVLWSITGKVEYKWTGMRVYDVALSPDGKKIVTICNENRLQIYSLTDFKKLTTIHVQSKMTCVSISHDSKYALVNLQDRELHLWDIEKFRLVRKFVGQKQENFIIRSCFGGERDSFIVSGSEDSHVFVWKKDDGSLIERLSGHAAPVNSVAWNPMDKSMFASASDDSTIRIWTNGSA
ncbi:WD40-repeat-containing domain protein [Lipomyces japonicus]|uniref:WD40-repeat-containing domain protein n=1 Tax=Lipomyces japonicus TaxID=56871 RepID=UPI0034CECEA9